MVVTSRHLGRPLELLPTEPGLPLIPRTTRPLLRRTAVDSLDARGYVNENYAKFIEM
jgi:hypothetical protein